MSPLNGFWIAISPTNSEMLDMACVSRIEHARFYPGSLPPEKRERLGLLSRKGPGRESEFAPAFLCAYDQVMPHHALAHKVLRRRFETI